MIRTSSASGLVAVLAVFLLSAAPLAAHGQGHEGEDDHHPHEVEPAGDHDHGAHPPHGSLGNVGAKLADPLSDLWSLQMNFQAPTFFDGDIVTGSPEVGGSLIVQPVMPLPMYGSGEDQWRLIVRPVVPIIFSQPKISSSGFTDKGGLGDLVLETVLAPPASFTGLPKQLILGAGPALGFPTSTTDAFGNQQFSAGPAVAVGWKTKKFTSVVFPTYLWGYADRHDRQRSTRDVSGLQLLYSLIQNPIFGGN